MDKQKTLNILSGLNSELRSFVFEIKKNRPDDKKSKQEKKQRNERCLKLIVKINDDIFFIQQHKLNEKVMELIVKEAKQRVKGLIEN